MAEMQRQGRVKVQPYGRSSDKAKQASVIFSKGTWRLKGSPGRNGH